MKSCWILMAATFLLVPTCAVSQNESKKRILLDEKKPGTYITFEKAGDREPTSAGEGDQCIWLRLHNNYRFSIAVPAVGDQTPGTDLGLIYSVSRIADVQPRIVLVGPEDQKQGPSLVERCASRPVPAGTDFDVFSTVQVKPGESVVFSIPMNHISECFYIETIIRFTFEDRLGSVGNSLRHVLSFSASGLPKAVRSKLP